MEREKPVLFTDEIDVSQDEKRDEHTAKTADDVDSAVFAQHSEQTHVADSELFTIVVLIVFCSLLKLRMIL